VRRLLILAGLGALSACTNMSGERTAHGAAAANVRPVGEPRDCLSLSMVRDSRVISDRIIDFHAGGKIYRNELPFACPSLGSERAFTFSTSLSQLCSSDTIRVIHQGGGSWLGASCGLGKFQQVELLPR
jgi:hypothetical protein